MSPGIFSSSDRLRCTTSSCDSGMMKRSLYSYIIANVSLSWCCERKSGSIEKYSRVSCIHPMFHLNVKPSPPSPTGCVTPGHAVDSSAIMMTPGHSVFTAWFTARRNSIASRFSRPPNLLRSHCPGARL